MIVKEIMLFFKNVAQYSGVRVKPKSDWNLSDNFVMNFTFPADFM